MANRLQAIFIYLLTLTSCQQADQTTLTIATSANMHFAMVELIDSFSHETGIICQSVISSSGKLSAQIKEGAPFDLFVSADVKYPQDLFDNGYAKTKPAIYAYGNLVLWTMVEDVTPALNILDRREITHIAVANPKTAPYGEAALEVLRISGMLDRVEHKLVYGESIAQTNQFITTQAAEIGITAKTVVLAPAMKGRGRWIDIDQSLYTPIAQAVVLLNRNRVNTVQAKKFHDFLFSQEAKEILNNFGYTVPGP